jgi:L-2,4-diaminobutyrate decarboxylase
MIDTQGADREAEVLAALEEDACFAGGEPFLSAAADYFRSAGSGEGPVSAPIAAAELAALFTGPPPRRGRGLADVVREFGANVVASSNRLAHPMAMGHQVSPPLPAAAWAEPLISALNQSLAVREMSPVATFIERSLIRWLADQCGLGAAAGGAFTSGGTEANFTALLAARAAVLPDAWQHGVGAQPPVLVCGEHAHYSMARAAGELGIGVGNVVTVATRDWRMDMAALPLALDRAVSEGRRVLAVVASAGSTATGSFDELAAIADICGDRGIWLHVDAAHGGSALLSAVHRHRLDGIERADSVSWDPHKMMLLPIPCSAVLVRNEARLDAAFAQAAPYLFSRPEDEVRPRAQEERESLATSSLDQGVRSFACSRRADVLKLWVALQRYGSDGMAALHDRLCRMARELHARITAHSLFAAVHEPESNILCFRWTGAHSATVADLDAFNLELRERWNASGEGWITTTVLDGRRVLRVTIMNPRTTESHLDALVQGLDRTAQGMLRDGYSSRSA